MDGPTSTKLSRADYDVIDISNGIELSYRLVRVRDASASSSPLTITIDARIEAEVISKAVFRYPKANLKLGSGRRGVAYRYVPGSKPGLLDLDGELTDESLGEKLFAEYIPVASGHPQGITYGWVMDDGRTLYAALDFTPDNTVDRDADFAAVWIDTPDGFRRYQVSENDETWGTSGFTYTDRVGYQHKVYEFAVPFNEIGVDEHTDAIKISFEAYGTASPIGLLVPDAVYNDLKNEILVVYGIDDQTDRDEDILDFNIKAEIFDYTGTTTGATTRIAELVDSSQVADPESLFPHVAYSPLSNPYLVVWQDDADDDSGTLDRQVWGRILDGDGATVGTAFIIADSADDHFDPDVVYEPVNDRFLVVWTGTVDMNDDIYGRFVLPTGTTSGSAFDVSDAASDQGSATAAVDPVNQRILVVFTDSRNEYLDIYGQFMSVSGQPIGDSSSNFIILTRAEELRYMLAPSLAFDPSRKEYLLVVDDGLVDTVMVRRIGSDGTLYDHDTDGDTTVDDDDYIEVNIDGANTDIAYNPVADTYLVTWDYSTGDPEMIDLQGSIIDGATLSPGSAQILSTTVERDDEHSSIAPNPYGGNYFVAFHKYYWNENRYELAAVTVGTYAVDPGLRWISGTDGATPLSGASGSTFAFDIEYVSESGTEPLLAELWIDLDYSGTYDDEAIVPPFRIMFYRFPAPFIPFAAAVLLICIATLVVRKRFVRPVYAAGALIVVCALLIVGCKWFEGVGTVSPGSYSAPPEGLIDYGLPEKYVMNEADPADTDVTDGRIYTVDVDITASPGEIRYRFVFSDGTRKAFGYGATERYITVTQ